MAVTKLGNKTLIASAVAAGGFLFGFLPAVVTYLETRQQAVVPSGDYLIMYEMIWRDALELVLSLAALIWVSTNPRRIVRHVRALTSAWWSHAFVMQGAQRRISMRWLAASFGLGLGMLSLTFSTAEFGREKARYWVRISQADFINRKLVLARSSMESFDFPGAKMIYESLPPGHEEDLVHDRLATIRDSDAVSSIASDAALRIEGRNGLTPTALEFRLVSASANPRQLANRIALAQYRNRSLDAISEYRAVKALCGQHRTPDAGSAIDQKYDLLIERDIKSRFKVGNEQEQDVRFWSFVCELILSNALNERSVNSYWHFDAVGRVLAFNDTVTPGRPKCTITQRGADLVRTVELGGGAEPSPSSRTDDDEGRESLGDYSSRLYSCHRGGWFSNF